MDITKFERKGVASNAWSGMVAAKDILRQGARKEVYSGVETFFFWRDVWIGNTPLLDLATKEIPMVESYKLVREYWNPLKGWKWGRVRRPPTTPNL